MWRSSTNWLPQDGERVVRNWPFDIFRCTGVERWLRDGGVETVVLVGVATGMAINIAAYQLADRFFSLIVPSDCVTDGNRRLHEAIMRGHHAGDRPRDDRRRRHRPPLIARVPRLRAGEPRWEAAAGGPQQPPCFFRRPSYSGRHGI